VDFLRDFGLGWAQISGWVFGWAGGLIGRVDLLGWVCTRSAGLGWAQPVPLPLGCPAPLNFSAP